MEIKKVIFDLLASLSLLLAWNSLAAQDNVTNIRVRQQDNILYVFYDLDANSDIELYVSLNDGLSFMGPMQKVTGDVGKDVKQGENKIITWNVVSELGYMDNPGVRFKIVANVSEVCIDIDWVNVMGGSYVPDGSNMMLFVPTYQISKNEITVAQFSEFVRRTKYLTTAERSGYGYVWSPKKGWLIKEGVDWRCDEKGEPRREEDYFRYPVAYVTWTDAMAFCNWAGCRLPTESEWEFAAMGGTRMDNMPYPGSREVGEVAWYYDNSDGIMRQICEKSPNELGIYDMGGNLSEWCLNIYSTNPNYLPAEDIDMGPNGYRSIRGGNFESDEYDCRTYSRNMGNYLSGGSLVGFRVAKKSYKDRYMAMLPYDALTYPPSIFGIRKEHVSKVPEMTKTVPSPVKKKIGGTFILANAGVNIANIEPSGISYGLMVGYTRRVGFYVKGRSNFVFRFEAADLEIDDQWLDDQWVDADKMVSSLSATAGLVVGATRHFYLYAGAGYGYRDLYLQTADGALARWNGDSVYRGVAADFGTIFKFGKFSLSLGASTIEFKNVEPEIGIGVMF